MGEPLEIDDASDPRPDNASAVRLLDEAISHAEGGMLATEDRRIREVVDRAISDLRFARVLLADPTRFAIRLDDRFTPSGFEGWISYAATTDAPCRICQSPTKLRVITAEAVWIVCPEHVAEVLP